MFDRYGVFGFGVIHGVVLMTAVVACWVRPAPAVLLLSAPPLLERILLCVVRSRGGKEDNAQRRMGVVK